MARILVVDDSPDTLHLVRATLESAGHQVLGVADPRDALEVVRNGAIDAAVLDVMMPGLSGWELLGSIRNEPGHERMPIVFLSAIGDSGNRTRGIRLGADDFLTKPFDPEELLVRLESLIARVAVPSLGLQGALESHPLTEVIQGLEQNSKTGTLEIACGARRGTLLFAAGKIASAEYAGYRDRAAVLALFDETRGHFRFIPGPVEAGRTRFEPSALLIEAAWIEDELAARRHCLPAPDQPLGFTGSLPAVPDGLRGLPIHELAAVCEAPGGATLDHLLEDRRFSPSTIRLTVAWMVQIGALEDGMPQSDQEMAGRSFARFLRATSPASTERPPEIALIVHAPAWELVAPLLATLPESLLGAEGAAERAAIWHHHGGTITLRQGSHQLRLSLDTFRDPDSALAGREFGGATTIVVWASEDLPFDSLERLLRNLETTAPPECRLLIVGALGALARGPRWDALPTTPESLEELLYELVEARG